jgi:hypothetical protein
VQKNLCAFPFFFDLDPSPFTLVSSSDPSSPSESPISTSSESLDLAEYCESPRCSDLLGVSSMEGVGIAAGKGDAGGRGRWLASVPKLALVGVVASSRIIC